MKDRKIKPQRMHEQVLKALAADIRDGTLTIGSELPSERELSEEFGVSRLTVREAVGALERSGLIETRAGTRARVTLPGTDKIIELLSGTAMLYVSTPSGLRAFQETRSVIEAGITRLAAERIDQAGLEHLQAALERNRSHIGNVVAFAKSDVDFHVAIAEIVGNEILIGFYHAAGLWLHDMRSVTLSKPQQMEKACAAHERIFAHIRDHEAEAAGRAMAEHIHQVNSVYAERETELIGETTLGKKD